MLVKKLSFWLGSSESSSSSLFMLYITRSLSSVFMESRLRFSYLTVLSLLWKKALVHKLTYVFLRFSSESSSGLLKL